MLRIDGKRIIPSPLISFNKNLVTLGDTRPISSAYNLILTGTLLPNQGSPISNGTFYTNFTGAPSNESNTTSDTKFNSILAKQEALRELLSRPGLYFEYGPDDSLSNMVSGRIRLSSISFDPGQWVDKCTYTINIEADLLNKLSTPTGEDVFGFGSYNLTQASDSLQISESENGSSLINITQSLSAVGKTTYSATGILSNNKEGWENARDWCLSQLNNQFATNILQVTGLARYNIRQLESIDRWAGSYSLQRNYSVVSGNTGTGYLHTYDIQRSSSRSQIDDLDDGQSITEIVTVNGSVQGLLPNSNVGSGRLLVAISGFNEIEPRISYYAGLGSGFLYTSRNVTESNINGQVDYSIVFTNYPTGTYTNIYTVNDVRKSNGQNEASINGVFKYNTVSGSITGLFDTARNYFITNILPNFKTRIQNLVGYNVLAEPISLGINYAKSNGDIEYNAVYIGIDSYNSNSQNYLDQFDVTVNDQNGVFAPYVYSNAASVTVNGTIIGLAATGGSNERYTRAATGWNIIKSDLKNRAAIAIGSVTGVSDRILSRSESHNKVNGSIQYSYVFSTRADLTNAGILSEDVNIETDLPKELFAIQYIPGINTGPIIQNVLAKSEARTIINAEFILDRGVDTSIAETRFTVISGLYAPTGAFRDSNVINRNLYTGRYTRSASWVYRIP